MQVDLCARVGLALAAALLLGRQPALQARQQSLQRQTCPEPALSGRQTELISASQCRHWLPSPSGCGSAPVILACAALAARRAQRRFTNGLPVKKITGKENAMCLH